MNKKLGTLLFVLASGIFLFSADHASAFPKVYSPIVEKGEIEVYFLVSGTIERTSSSTGKPAARLGLVGKKHQCGVAVGASVLFKDLSPDIFGVREYYPRKRR